MSSKSYEDEIRTDARKWAEAQTFYLSKAKAAEEARREAERARASAETLERKLSKCVGANIQRRVIVLNDGVVIVQYHERGNHVSLEAPL